MSYIRTEIKDSKICLRVRHVSAAWTRRMYEVPFLDLLLKDNVCNFWFFFYSLLSVGFTFLVNISSTITNRKRSWWLPGWLNPPLSGPAQIIATDRWLWDSGSFLCFLFPLLFFELFQTDQFPLLSFFSSTSEKLRPKLRISLLDAHIPSSQQAEITLIINRTSNVKMLTFSFP